MTCDTGSYLLVTYANRPFRSLHVGTIDTEVASRMAFDALSYAKFDTSNSVDNSLSYIFGNIKPFLSLKDRTSLRSVSKDVLEIANKDMEFSFKPPTNTWGSEENDNTNVEWEYDTLNPLRINGILRIRLKSQPELVHVYFLVEGRGLMYVIHDKDLIYRIYNLADKPIIDGTNIKIDYDTNDNRIVIGYHRIEYLPERSSVKVDGFTILNRGFQGDGHFQFTDYKGIRRKINLIAERGWWKYVIFHDILITEITSKLNK